MRLINNISLEQIHVNSELCIYEVSYQIQSCRKNPTADLDLDQGVPLGQWNTLKERNVYCVKLNITLFWLSKPLKKLLSNRGPIQQFVLVPQAWTELFVKC